MATLQVNGVTYFYAISHPVPSTEDKPPLLLLHGLRVTTANWQPQVQRSLPTARRSPLICLATAKPQARQPARYQMAASAADLATLLAAGAPGPVNLLGYSMGGRLALYFALTYGHLVQRNPRRSAWAGNG